MKNRDEEKGKNETQIEAGAKSRQEKGGDKIKSILHQGKRRKGKREGGEESRDNTDD